MWCQFFLAEKPDVIDAPAGSVMCKVCDDYANGVHFGVTSCEGCKVSISNKHSKFLHICTVPKRIKLAYKTKGVLDYSRHS